MDLQTSVGSWSPKPVEAWSPKPLELLGHVEQRVAQRMGGEALASVNEDSELFNSQQGVNDMSGQSLGQDSEDADRPCLEVRQQSTSSQVLPRIGLLGRSFGQESDVTDQPRLDVRQQSTSSRSLGRSGTSGRSVGQASASSGQPGLAVREQSSSCRTLRSGSSSWESVAQLCSVAHFIGPTTTSRSKPETQVSYDEIVEKLTTLETPDLLRGTPHVSVLQVFGRIFLHGQGSAHTYSLSKKVERLDAFISHNWSVPARTKFLSLALHFNGRSALLACLSMALTIQVATMCGSVPVYDPRTKEGVMGFVAPIACPLFYLLVLCLQHEVYRYLGIDGNHVFLDKTCIHQTDPELKRKGIESLSAFIAQSDKIVVVYTDEYVKKLWTVYELATFLILFPEKPVVVIPTVTYCIGQSAAGSDHLQAVT
eukprot:TRINITY_DN30933_c0_g1_i2.p1 TRINITY_DN30933_c0_g1~~TRINITY_DN30933_c0_g1_i2.p1  ORF type:complete len:453 (+),score=12.17 TRINITY_DN30933_c0_g1_i2:86-1360(+)